jgi:hypothetical protein
MAAAGRFSIPARGSFQEAIEDGGAVGAAAAGEDPEVAAARRLLETPGGLGVMGSIWAARAVGGIGLAGAAVRASPARRSEGHRCEVVLEGCGCCLVRWLMEVEVLG